MALPINVSDLIQQRVIESARIEYKSDWNPEPILHSICAFANDIDNWGGGYIIIGIDEEKGKVQLSLLSPADLEKRDATYKMNPNRNKNKNRKPVKKEVTMEDATSRLLERFGKKH